jgi:signal peptide peptidase SppA
MSRLYELACTVSWLITPEALEAMLSIAERDPLAEDEIARRMHGPQSLAMRQASGRDDSARMAQKDGIALIPIDGPIYRYADMFTEVSGGVTTDSLATDFQKALDDPAVAGVLFVIDSPGGESTGINELSDAIYAARGTKPIGAYVEGYGASAAYWIASACDWIACDDTALVGSIGTVLGVADPAKRVSRTIDFASKQSPKKRADPTTEAGKQYFQSMVDSMTEVFIAKVARNRNVTAETVLSDFGQGGLLVGQQAVTAGLADRLGSEEQAIADLVAESAARTPRVIKQEVSRMAEIEQKGGFWAWVRGTPDSAEPPTTPPNAPPAPPVPASAESAELAQLRAALAKAQAERITQDAAAFVTAQIAAGHAYPAEQAALAQLYALLAQDDAAHPVTSGATRIAHFTAAIESRPANRLAGNLLPSTLPPGAAVLTNTAGDGAGLDEAEASARAYAAKANGRSAK